MFVHGRSPQPRKLVLTVLVAVGVLAFLLRYAFEEARESARAESTEVVADSHEVGSVPGSKPELEQRRVAEREALPGLDEPAAASPASSWITGVVTERSGAALAAAVCRLHPGVARSGFFDESALPASSAHATARSGLDGAFRLPAGRGFWRVTVESPGFARFERDHLVEGDDLRVTLDALVQVVVSVVDPSALPVGGAQVVVRRADATARESSRCALETGSDGRAATTDLGPGRWFLTVRHPLYATTGVPLEIPAGRFSVEHEVRLEGGTRIVGTVRSDAGEPIPGARVRIESPYRGFFHLDEVVCDASGRFESARAFRLYETLELLASAPGHAECKRLIGIQPDEVAAGEAVVDLVLADGMRRLQGRVVAGVAGLAGASIRLAALDPVGASADDVLAALQAAPAEPWLWQSHARTDSAGEFEITGLSAVPQYVVLAVHPDYAPRMSWVPPGEPETLTRLADIALEASAFLFGRASFEDGSPAAGAELLLSRVEFVRGPPGSRATWRPMTWFVPLALRVETDGSFRFDSLAPGTYELISQAGFHEVEAGRATGPVEVRVVREERAGEVVVAGTVRDHAGAPITPVFVKAFDLSGSASAQLADAELVTPSGAFSLTVGASQALELTFADLAGVHEELRLHVNAPLPDGPLDVVLERRAQRLPPIEGLVAGPDGAPLQGSRVALHPSEDSLCACISFRATTDALGAFRFESVSDGELRLVVSDARFPSEVLHPVRAGDSLSIQLGR